MAWSRARSTTDRAVSHQAKPTRRRPWLRRLGLTLLALLLAPTAIVALYRWVPPPITPLMLIRLAEGDGLDKDWRPLDRISPHLARAVIAAEDNWFCRHGGFDWPALQDQLTAAFRGDRARGASTITMQTAKNILLWPGRDVSRKVLEAWLTPQLELLWGKRRILEIYLNVAEFGTGVFGAEAAARRWFARPASELTAEQAARLAAILPNPRAWSPVDPGPEIRSRAATILGRIDQLGPLLDCAP